MPPGDQHNEGDEQQDPEALGALERLVEPSTRGDPESLLRWTRYVLSSRHADEGVSAVLAEPQMIGAPRFDAWSREAERLRIAAAQAGQPLDEDAIQLLDVYDLRALRAELERAGRKHGAPRGLLHRLPMIGGALIREVVGAS